MQIAVAMASLNALSLTLQEIESHKAELLLLCVQPIIDIYDHQAALSTDTKYTARATTIAMLDRGHDSHVGGL
jgi:hypothetical protein